MQGILSLTDDEPFNEVSLCSLYNLDVWPGAYSEELG